MLFPWKQDPSLGFPDDVSKTIFLAIQHPEFFSHPVGHHYRPVTDAVIAWVLRAIHSLELKRLRRRKVRKIYNYISRHPEYAIHKRWANCDRSDPEVRTLVKDFDGGLEIFPFSLHCYNWTIVPKAKGKKSWWILYLQPFMKEQIRMTHVHEDQIRERVTQMLVKRYTVFC